MLAAVAVAVDADAGEMTDPYAERVREASYDYGVAVVVAEAFAVAEDEESPGVAHSIHDATEFVVVDSLVGRSTEAIGVPYE